MLAWSRRLRWTFLVLPLLLMASVACEMAPSSTPTSTPVPLPEPIVLSLDAGERDLFEALPQEEQQCLVQTLGQARLEQILDGEDPTQEEDRMLEQCVSQEISDRIFVGFFVGQVGGLGDDTLSCMWDILGGADLKALSTASENFSREFVAVLSSALCLSDVEAARAELVAGPGGFHVSGMLCLAQQIDLDGLATTFRSGLEGPPPEMIATMLECGINVLGPEGDWLQFDTEQFACLEAVLGDTYLAQFLAQYSESPFEAIAAMIECGIGAIAPEGDDGGGGDGNGRGDDNGHGDDGGTEE